MTERRLHCRTRSDGGFPGTSKCYFCASESLQFYCKSSSWSTDTLQWAEKIVSQAIPTEAVACRACEKFIKRHVGETNVTPRWLPKQSKEVHYCIVEGCSEVVHTTASFVTYKVAQEYIAIPHEPTKPLSLCNTHYQYLYREVNFPKLCATCSAQPKYGEEYKHCCPDPQKISSFLLENLNFCGKRTKDSKLCNACFMFHYRILQQLNNESAAEPDSLTTLLSNLEKKMEEFEQKDHQSFSNKLFLEWCVCSVFKHLYSNTICRR